MEPASIRYKNPGAMWGNAIAKKWGSTGTVMLHDGLGQGNNIAVFPTYVQGICAQLDLWRTSPNYKNKRFADAIAIWSGHNNVESYIYYVLARVPGMTRTTVMDDTFWRGPLGVSFLQAQAGHEAGKTYPAPRADWIEAQNRVFDVAPPASAPASAPAPTAPRPPSKKAAAIVVASTSAGAAAHAAGATHTTVAIVVIAVAVAALFGLIIYNKVAG